MQTTEPYSIFIVWKDGVIVAAQRETKTVFRDDEGNLIAERPNPAEAIPLDLGKEVLGQINAGLLSRIEADAAAHLAQIETLKAAHAAELTTLREQLAAATAPPAAPPVLSQLATVFGSLEPAIQRAFASAFATVRTLIQADQVGLARGYIEDLDVPEELAETKAGILSMLA